MRPTYSAEAEAFREKVQAFLAEQLPSNWAGVGQLDHEALARFTRDWRATLYEHGYLALGWPAEYGGGGLSALEQVIVAEEFAKAGVPVGRRQRRLRHPDARQHACSTGAPRSRSSTTCPRILSGEDIWCQGYSEPNAGSDLGGLGCRAVLDGDQWVINGQKIWTSAGHLADHIFVLARTDPDAPKHKGISFLLVRMDQPGVEVRPIKMISGDSEFNEVFFTDATCPEDDVVGGVNNGWARGHDAARLRARRGGGHHADPVPGRARPPAGAGQGARRRPTTRRSASASPGATRRCRSCAGSACGRSPASSPASGPGPESSHLQAVLERVPPRGHRAGARHPRAPTRWCRAGGRRRRPSRPTTPARRTPARRGPRPS